MSGGMSPAPAQAQTEMDFFEAMRVVKEGKKVSRRDWKNDDCVFLFAGFLHLRKSDGTLHKLLVSDGDMEGTDWVIVREQ